jgi:hypothetical protein
MGGGGAYYDRDVTDRSYRTSRGYSSFSDRMMSSRRIDPAVRPKNRRLITLAKSPLAYVFDDTGSVGGLAKIICDKWPMIVGQLTVRGYLDDPAVSLACVGDVVSDRAPLQICDFAPIRSLDGWLKKLWLEHRGGGTPDESYELMAYYYAYLSEMPNAVTPIFLITGDQTFRYNIPAKVLRKWFGNGGNPAGEALQETNAVAVFADLLKKFRGNAFYLHREHRGKTNAAIIRQWTSVLGEERVVLLPNDLAVGDIALGICAMASGSRTLDEYCADMRTRVNAVTGRLEPQSKERVAEVRQALLAAEAGIVQRLAASGMGKSAEAPKPRRGRKRGVDVDEAIAFVEETNQLAAQVLKPKRKPGRF